MRSSPIAIRPVRTRPLALLLLCTLLSGVLVLGACKKGEGDAQAANGDAANKGPEAVPVEVAVATRRPIAASYSGTAARSMAQLRQLLVS